MNEVTFEWGKLKIQVRAEMAGDVLERGGLLAIIASEAIAAGDVATDNDQRIIRVKAYWYGRMITTSKVLEGEPPFTMIDITQATGKEVYTSYCEFMTKTPATLWEMWREAIEQANNEALDPEG